ncbi:hypothetical protein [Salinibacterium sp. ZJ454]|uniref:hypothetical protein n=1 Tax=Salinibacterium sp. ZJ454 TaxID=2708339 RepID=UPI00141FE227|nr:hypothetical protein [Salinibacterium sp. ZJ454]
MLELALIFPLVVVATIVALSLARRGPFRTLAIEDVHRQSAEWATRRIRLRNAIAMTAAVVFAAISNAVAIFSMQSTDPLVPVDPLHWFLLTPMLTAIVTIAFFALVPTFREAGEIRSAELTRRTPLMFGPRTTFAVPIVAAVVLIALVVACGIIANVDGRMFIYDNGPSGGFPGFAYGVPLLIGVALLAAATALALVRIASAPRPTDPSLREADSTVRLLAIRVTMKTVSAAVALTTGFLLLWSGSTAESMARQSRIDVTGDLIPTDATLQVIGVAGTIGICVGIAFVVATIVFVVGAVSDGTRKPFEAVSVAPKDAPTGAEQAAQPVPHAGTGS